MCELCVASLYVRDGVVGRARLSKGVGNNHSPPPHHHSHSLHPSTFHLPQVGAGPDRRALRPVPGGRAHHVPLHQRAALGIAPPPDLHLPRDQRPGAYKKRACSWVLDVVGSVGERVGFRVIVVCVLLFSELHFPRDRRPGWLFLCDVVSRLFHR